MSFNVSGIQPILIPQIDSPSKPGASGGGEFSNILASAIGQVQQSRQTASQNVQSFLKGEGEDLHSTILSVQRADLEFEMFMQVRNKVVSAYQEIMRMQM